MLIPCLLKGHGWLPRDFLDGVYRQPLIFIEGNDDDIEALRKGARWFERLGKPSGDGNIYVSHQQFDLSAWSLQEQVDLKGGFIGYYERRFAGGGNQIGYLYSDGATAISCRPQADSVGARYYTIHVASRYLGWSWSTRLQNISLLLTAGITTYQDTKPTNWPKQYPPPPPELIVEACKKGYSYLRQFLGTAESGEIWYGCYNQNVCTIHPKTGQILWQSYVKDPRNAKNINACYMPWFYYQIETGGYIEPSAGEPERGNSPLGEWSWAMEQFELVSLPYLDDALSQACMDLYTTLPEAQMNTFANLLDIVGTLRDFKHGNFSGIGSMADAWLSYRYAFNTTKSDIEEYAHLLNRLIDLCDREYSLHGHFSKTYYAWQGDQKIAFEVEAHVTATSKLTQLDTRKIKNFMDRAGLKLNLLNAWDLVPYSFVVDWFLPISKLLGNMDAMYEEQHINYDVYGWCSSVQVTYSGVKGSVSNYARKVGYKPPLKVTSAVSGSDPLGRGAFYHIADTLALWRK